MRTDVTGYLYAASMTAGGAYQAMYKKSPRYFVYGAICGAAASLGAHQTSKNANDINIMLLTSGGYAASMLVFHQELGKLMPFGPSAIISMFMFMRCLLTKAFPKRKNV